MTPPLPLGTKTPYGNIEGIHSKAGERSYFITNKAGVVTLIPAEILEKDIAKNVKPD